MFNPPQIIYNSYKPKHLKMMDCGHKAKYEDQCITQSVDARGRTFNHHVCKRCVGKYKP